MRKVPIPFGLLNGAQSLGQEGVRRIRRHPLPIETHFKHSLVVTWAFAPQDLEQFLVPGLKLDTYTNDAGESFAFAAVAMVDLDQLRLAGMPRRLSSSHVMTGYRVFCTMQTASGTTMRGLRILASQTSNLPSSLGANLTTRYHYSTVQAKVTNAYDVLNFSVTSRDGVADLDVSAHLNDARLPESTPFDNAHDARRFAGPLPYTFSPDPEGIVVVKSDRTDWYPTPVAVDIAKATFFDHGPFEGVDKTLANAFHLADLDYGWRPGELHRQEDIADRSARQPPHQA